MKKNKIIILIIGVIISFIICYQNYFLKTNKIDKSQMVAIFVENDSGEYEPYTKSIWPKESDGYKYNEEKTNCIDALGNKLFNIITYDKDENTVYLNTNTAAQCNIYFDLKD